MHFSSTEVRECYLYVQPVTTGNARTDTYPFGRYTAAVEHHHPGLGTQGVQALRLQKWFVLEYWNDIASLSHPFVGQCCSGQVFQS